MLLHCCFTYSFSSRFLGSLSDFDPAVHAVKTENLADIDKYMLGKLTETVKEVKREINYCFKLYFRTKF